MTEEYILHKDVITNHKDRMFYLRKYFPYFKITENNFSQFQNGKYESLDMGYLLMAVLRFFIEENNFREKDVTYQEYSSFIKEIYERDFGLVLDQAEEQSLSSYIFDKITNEGRPFLWSYYDPVEKKKETLRVRLLDSRVTKEGVYYRLTSEAIEFYLDTKEIQDESDISVSQVLLSKMIASRNFRGGIQVVQRMNNQVARLQKQREEVLGLLAGDVFHGIRAYEKFMENGTKWFAEEQKMFHKNMELIEEALKRADTEAAYGQAVKDIYDLESELKRARINHSRLLSDCTKLQIQADEMIAGAKYSRLKKNFDFKEAQCILMEENNAARLEAFILPLLRIQPKKRFSLLQVDKLLTLRMDREEKGEEIAENVIPEMYVTEDEKEENRIRENYRLYVRILLYDILKKDSFTIEEWCGDLVKMLGKDVLKNSDLYSMMIHLAQKNQYSMQEVMQHPDTFFEEYLKMILQEEPAYRKLDFKIEYLEHKFCPMAGCEIKNFRIVKGEQTWH